MMAALKSKAYTNNRIQWTSNWMLLSALILGEAVCVYVHLFFISFPLLLLLLFSYSFEEKKICIYFICYISYCEVFHSVHSPTLITSSILQPNAHYTLYLPHFFLPNLCYTFRCVIRQPQEEFRKFAQNCQLYTGVLISP